MDFISIKCPNCNSNVSFEDGQTSIFCSACGTKIEREIFKKNQAVPITNNFNDLDSLLIVGNEFLKNEDFINAKKKFSDAINIEPNNVEALFGIYICELYRIEDLYMQNYYESSSIKVKDVIRDIENKYYLKACENANDSQKLDFSSRRDKLKKELNVFRAKQSSNSSKKFNSTLFIILLILFYPAAFIYLIVYAIKKNC